MISTGGASGSEQSDFSAGGGGRCSGRASAGDGARVTGMAREITLEMSPCLPVHTARAFVIERDGVSGV